MRYSDKFIEILKNRGVEGEAAIERYLYPNIDDLGDVNAYSGFREAKDRIERAISDGETIVIYGDYDSDGVCSVAMLYDFLSKRGANVSYFIPDRHKDGYGINLEAVEMIAENYFPDLIITVDCGITAVEEIRIIMEEMGIDVIVTDHHEPKDVIPDTIIVNAKIDREKGLFDEYSGGGIVFRLIEYISDIDTAMNYIDVAAISTIGDIVPLIGDNRIIASIGLKAISNTKRLGLKLLIDSFIKKNNAVTSYDVSFKIVPRINSMGRLDDASRAVDLFISDDYFEMKTLVEELDRMNLERQEMTERTVNEALDMLETYSVSDKSVITLYSDKWDSGIIGIAASKIVSLFNRPVILLAKDENGIYKGSCRSIDSVNLYEELCKCSELLEHFGGHRMACGLSIKGENIGKLKDKLNALIDINLTLSHKNNLVTINDCKEITSHFAKEMALLEPFGQSNPDVKFAINIGKCDFRQISSTDHIKYRLHSEFEMVGFNRLSEIRRLNLDINKSIEFKIKYSEFNNIDYASGTISNITYDTEGIKDDSLAVSEYIKTFLRDKESVFDVEEFDDSILKNSKYGTCLIAFTKESFNNAKIEYGEYISSYDLSTFDSVNPLNRLELGFDVNNNYLYYDNVVFLTPLRRHGVIDYMKLNPNCRVFTKSQESDIIKKIVLPDYGNLGKIFIAIRNELNVKQYYGNNLYELYEAMVKTLNIDYVTFSIAFYTFFDLKIIVFKNGIMTVDKSAKTKLDNSVFYNELKELVNNADVD